MSNIRPLCLPVDANKDYAGATATVTGWGTLEFFGSSPEKLQEVNVTVLSNSDCRTSTAYDAEDILDNMLCAGDTQAGGKDSCQGDSGGPLITTEGSGTVSGENYEVIGVVSFGIGCGLAFAPGVYARYVISLNHDAIIFNTGLHLYLTGSTHIYHQKEKCVQDEAISTKNCTQRISYQCLL